MNASAAAKTRHPGEGLRRYLGRLATAPTLHFLVLGALAWTAFSSSDPEPKLIVIDETAIEAVAGEWLSLSGQPLSASQREDLIQELARQTVLVDYARTRGLEEAEPVRQRLVQLAHFLDLVETDASEAKALNAARALDLHRSDPVIKRFLANAGEMVLAGQLQAETIEDSDILRHYRRHRDRFLQPAVVALRHVYIADSGADGKRRAGHILEAIRQGELPDSKIPGAGDIFFGGHELPAQPQDRIAATMGGDFHKALEVLSEGQWSTPIRSAYGWHLVNKRTVTPGGLAPLSQVRDKIRSNIVRQRRDAAVASKVAALRNQYHVVIGDAG